MEAVPQSRFSRRTGKTHPVRIYAVHRSWCRSERSKRRVAVIVNRVHTAGEVDRTLREQVEGSAEVVLLTGRIRPFERDRLVEKWKPFLKAASPDEPEKPILFVSTQCIEVGADRKGASAAWQ